MATANRLTRSPLVHRLVINPFVFRLIFTSFATTRFASQTRLLGGDDWLFFNYGYEEDPPMGIPLDAADEPHRYFIQLYHRTATQVDLSGKRVLECSCGHGGGASYLVRTQHPASYTGLDLNPAGIEFAKNRHHLPNLDFVVRFNCSLARSMFAWMSAMVEGSVAMACRMSPAAVSTASSSERACPSADSAA